MVLDVRWHGRGCVLLMLGDACLAGGRIASLSSTLRGAWGGKERQQREQCVRPPFASLSSHSLSCLSSLTSPPSAPRHTPLCTTDDCPVCTVPRLPGEKERQQREQCVHSPLRLSFLSLSHSLSCFSSLPFRLLRQVTHPFTCQVSPCVHRSASCSPRAAAALLLFRLVSLLSTSLSLLPSFSLSISLPLSRGRMRDKWEPHDVRISSLAPCPER